MFESVDDAYGETMIEITADDTKGGILIVTMSVIITDTFAYTVSTPYYVSSPHGIAVDSADELYYVNTNLSIINYIDSSTGDVTTIAGDDENYATGYDNGVTTNARFYYPYGIAIDSNDNIYVADSDNNIIRKITSTGNVTTIAGTGGADNDGFDDGDGANASFNNPMGIAVDSNGNIFVADTGNHAIRKITSTGTVSTIAGSGSDGLVNDTGTSAQFDSPQGIAVDSNGNIYVADTSNHVIRAIDSTGTVTTFAGSGDGDHDDGQGSDADFFMPQGIAIDSNDNIYVADTGNYIIRKIDPDANVITIAGSKEDERYNYTDGDGATEAGFKYPLAIAVDSEGNIYVSDHYQVDDQGNIIRKIVFTD